MILEQQKCINQNGIINEGNEMNKATKTEQKNTAQYDKSVNYCTVSPSDMW